MSGKPRALDLRSSFSLWVMPLDGEADSGLACLDIAGNGLIDADDAARTAEWLTRYVAWRRSASVGSPTPLLPTPSPDGIL